MNTVADIRNRIIQCSTKPVAHESKELGTIFLRRMTLGELNSMQDAAKRDEGSAMKVPASVRLLARFIGDETGKAVFDPEKKEDQDILLGLSVSTVADILNAGNAVNNMAAGDGPGKA